jgi:hypothetical protein
VEGLRGARIELVSDDLVGSGFGMHQRVVVVFAVQQLLHQARILIAQSLQRFRVQAQEFILRIGQVPCSTLIFPPTPVSTSKANSPCASCDAKLLGFAVCDAKSPVSRNRSVKPPDVWLATTGGEITMLSGTWTRSSSASNNRLRQTDRVRSAVRRQQFSTTTFRKKLPILGPNSIHVTTYGSFVTVMILKIDLLSPCDLPAMFHVKRVRFRRIISAMFHVEREPLPSPT